MNKQHTPAAAPPPLSDDAIRKIRHAYHSLEAFQQTLAHEQAKAKLRHLLDRPSGGKTPQDEPKNRN